MSTFSLIALLLSIFNIVNLLVSNANNNNNRNNINDNANNQNLNSNTESNANAGQSSANQVCMVVVYAAPTVQYRRRTYTEEKAKAVADVWGTVLIKFLVALASLHQDDAMMQNS